MEHNIFNKFEESIKTLIDFGNYKLPLNKEDLLIEISSEIEWLKLKVPDLIMIIERLNSNLYKLKINSPRGLYLFGWLKMVTEYTSIISTCTVKTKSMFTEAEYYENLSLKLKSMVVDVILDDFGDNYNSVRGEMILNIFDLIIQRKDYRVLKGMLSKYEREQINLLEDLLNEMFKYFETYSSEMSKYIVDLILKEYKRINLACQIKNKLKRSVETKNKADLVRLSSYIERTKILNATMHIRMNLLFDLLLLSRNNILINKKLVNSLIGITNDLESIGRIGDDVSTLYREIENKDYSNILLRKILIDNGMYIEKSAKYELLLRGIIDSLLVRRYHYYYNRVGKKISKFKIKVFDLNLLRKRYLDGFFLQYYTNGEK